MFCDVFAMTVFAFGKYRQAQLKKVALAFIISGG